MMNKMMSSGEAQVVRFNLDQIERQLGHKVPSGYLDYSSLTEMLSPSDVNRICYNIKEVERNRRYSNRNSVEEGVENFQLIILIFYGASKLLVWFCEKLCDIPSAIKQLRWEIKRYKMNKMKEKQMKAKK